MNCLKGMNMRMSSSPHSGSSLSSSLSLLIFIFFSLSLFIRLLSSLLHMHPGHGYFLLFQVSFIMYVICYRFFSSPFAVFSSSNLSSVPLCIRFLIQTSFISDIDVILNVNQYSYFKRSPADLSEALHY